MSGDSENGPLLLHCYLKCYNIVYNTFVVAPTGPFSGLHIPTVCAFALLHVAHSASSSVRFCLLLDYIKPALLLFIFLTDFHCYVRG